MTNVAKDLESPDRLNESLNAFLNSPRISHRIESLRRYLTRSPERATAADIVPPEELDKRISLAYDIEAAMSKSFLKPFQPKNAQLATMLVIPLQKLREAASSIHNPSPNKVSSGFCKTWKLFSAYVRVPLPPSS
jgi:hypothetical protein